MRALLGNGDGSFASAVSYPAGFSPHTVVVADFDGDTIPDLAVALYTPNNVSVLLGTSESESRKYKSSFRNVR